MPRLLWILLIVQVFAGQLKDHFDYNGNHAGTENVRFTLNQIQLSQDGEAHKFDYDYTGYVVEEGKPELPVFSTAIEVDPFTSYRLEYDIIRSYTVANKSIRAAAEITLDKNKHEQGLTRALNISEKFPSEFVRLMEPKVMRGLEIIQIEVTPFQVDPSDQSLFVIEEMDIRLIPVKDRQPKRQREIPQNRIFSQMYAQSILNYSRTVEDNNIPPVIIYICGGNIASNSSFQQLAAWRHKRGYEVHVVSVSEIGSSATSIKNYIQNAYDNWENPPAFVCLVGDATGTYTVPTFHENYSDYYGEGDHPFTLLDGNDQIPDIVVGRLPVRSTANMATLATKTMVYEKAIDMDDNWYEKAALIGDPSDSGISTIITGEYIQQVMEYNNMEDIRTNFSNGNYSTWMRSQMSEGMLYFSYRGFYNVSNFTQSTIDQTTNGFKLPFCTFLTCGTGSFEDAGVDGGSVCFSEKLVVAGSSANPKGCVTAISTATWGTHTLFNNAVNLGIYEGIFTHHVETAGEALTSGKLHLLNTYPSNPYNFATIFCYWNSLMGDPALHLWTDTPIIPVVQFDSVIPHGSNEIEFHILDEFDNPISQAQVTLLKGDDEIFLNRRTDEDGRVTIPLSYSSAGNVEVTVTGKNIKPFEGSFNIDDNMASVNIESSSITIEEIGTSNNDNLWSAGETINLYIPLRNFGNVDVNGVAATMTSTSDLVTITTPGVSYGNITVGAITPSYPFEIAISEEAMELEPAGLHLIIIDDQGQSWGSGVNVPVSGGKFEILDVNINGNNTYLTPSGTSYLTLDLKNAGTMPMSYITASLTPLNANIDVLTEMVYDWQGLIPGQSEENINPFEIEVGEGYINGANVSFIVDIHANGFSQSIPINVTVGQVTVNDPVGPDAYGYYIYDTGDAEYDLAPYYDWIEIDPGYGGDGTDLNISDNGNNQDESMVIDLPFLVRFYGQDYSQITVCSNGWISFGNSPMESFRNYPIPGAGGPSPMLAVFWDDLKTTSGGDIFSQYFPSDGIDLGMFVIQWSDVRTYDENSTESFQAVIYNNIAVTPPFGDNEIKLQYKEFNNTSNGDYYIGGWNDPPVHGGYCTIGTEDQSGTIGLQYTFNNVYNPAAKVLSDGEALFITTRSGELFPPPTMELSQDQFSYNLGVNEIIEDNFTFTNTGEQGSILIYTLDKVGFLNPGSAPDQSGMMWSDSDREESIDFNWIDISTTGTEAYFLHNDVATSPVNLGFEFPFYNENYTSCIINPNGWIGFGEDSDDWSNSDIPSPNAPHPAVLAFWDDLNPVSSDSGCSGDNSGTVYFQSFGDKFVVTYDEVFHCGGSEEGVYTFQIVLTSSGRIIVNYDEMSGNVESATIGVQNSNGYSGHQVVYNNDYLHDELSLIFDKDPDWLNLNNQSAGQLYSGETNTVNFTLNTTGYSTGNYTAYFLLNSNAGETITIPFDLSIDMGILGDVNDDGLVNVSDIVLIVTFILEQNTPDSFQQWASDLNNDGSINVVDIVIMVEMILGNL